MKKFFALILALVMALSLVACGGGSNGDNGGSDVKAKLRFVTGGESGTYYAFGSVIAAPTPTCRSCKTATPRWTSASPT